VKRIACRLMGHRWFDATWITWRNPETGGRHKKGTQRCDRCRRVERPFVAS
jgi:hypothetical protein